MLAMFFVVLLTVSWNKSSKGLGFCLLKVGICLLLHNQNVHKRTRLLIVLLTIIMLMKWITCSFCKAPLPFRHAASYILVMIMYVCCFFYVLFFLNFSYFFMLSILVYQLLHPWCNLFLSTEYTIFYLIKLWSTDVFHIG